MRASETHVVILESIHRQLTEQAVMLPVLPPTAYNSESCQVARSTSNGHIIAVIPDARIPEIPS